MASPTLATGAGAGQGLQEILQNMLAEAASKRADAALAETSRHNIADEGLRGKEYDFLAQQRKDALDQAKTVARESGAERGIKTLAPGTAVGAPTFANRFAGTTQEGNFSPEQTLPSVQSGGGVMITPGDTSDTAPATQSLLRMSAAPSQETGRQVFRGTPEQQKSAEEDAKLEAVGNDPNTSSALKSFIKLRSAMPKGENIPYQLITEPNGPEKRNPVADHAANRQYDVAHPLPDRVIMPTAEGFQPRSAVAATLAAGGTVQPQDSAVTRNRRDMATAIGSHFDDAQSLLDEAQKRGLLGPLQGRTFTDFLAGKVGSTGNESDDALLGDLRTSLSMIRSGTASLHGRSGANMGIIKELQNKMDEGHMSYAELSGSLKALKSWVDTYASNKKASTVSPDDKDPLGILKK